MLAVALWRIVWHFQTFLNKTFRAIDLQTKQWLRWTQTDKHRSFRHPQIQHKQKMKTLLVPFIFGNEKLVLVSLIPHCESDYTTGIAGQPLTLPRSFQKSEKSWQWVYSFGHYIYSQYKLAISLDQIDTICVVPNIRVHHWARFSLKILSIFKF